MSLDNSSSVTGLTTRPDVPYEVNGSGSSVNADIITQTDVSQIPDCSIQIVGTWSGTITFQVSNDGVNWVSTVGMPSSQPNAVPQTTTSSNASILINLGYKYFRARLTSYVSGTATAYFFGSHSPTARTTVGGSVGVTGNPPVCVAPRGSGGASTSRKISDGTTSATNIKSAAGSVYGILAFNSNASVRYLKIYNKATAPVVGTDTPVLTIPLSPNSQPTTFEIVGDMGLAFANGIGIALTTLPGDSDTTAPAASEIFAHVFYG